MMIIFLGLLIVLTNLFSIGLSVPLKKGEAGKAWTEEEIDIVRDKVVIYSSIKFWS